MVNILVVAETENTASVGQVIDVVSKRKILKVVGNNN